MQTVLRTGLTARCAIRWSARFVDKAWRYVEMAPQDWTAMNVVCHREAKGKMWESVVYEDASFRRLIQASRL
jgi:hypothetical protein